MLPTLPLAAGPQFLICFHSPPEFDHEDFLSLFLYMVYCMWYTFVSTLMMDIYIYIYQVYKPIGLSGFCRAQPGSFVKWNSMYFHKMLKVV